MDKSDITPGLVHWLVADQFPQWGGLPVRRVALDGWDNTTFRLGEEMLVRLPSADIYVPQVEKEQRSLPYLGPQLPLAIPQPLAKGAPDPRFTRPWSIYRWLPGEPATVERVADLVELAADLARFLAALQRVDATGGPAAGPHSFFRGGPLATYDAETRDAITALGAKVDGGAATAVWEAALAASPHGPPVWVHGDIAPSNLLVDGRGHLTAVIDFGCSAIGDPACDLVMAWTFFSGESRRAFIRGLALDEATWARAAGWALWKALITVARLHQANSGEQEAARRRFGWRWSAPEVIDEVLADRVVTQA